MPRIAVNGVHLNVTDNGNGYPLVMLHGFTGNVSNWGPHLGVWSEFRCVSIDLLGHGLSDCPDNPSRYQPELAVQDVLALFDCLSINRAVILGYSMGGRLALLLSLMAPERVQGLILESASFGINNIAERNDRVTKDEELASFIEMNGVQEFVDYWENLPLFSSQRKLPNSVQAAVRSQRLQSRAKGLANSLRGMSVGHQKSVLDQVPSILLPSLIVVGENDQKYCDIGKHMASLMPKSQLEIIPNCGHTVHLESPIAFANIVKDYASSCWIT